MRWFYVVKPTVEMLLCKTQKLIGAEGSVSAMEKPLDVMEGQLVRSPSEPLEACFAFIEKLENEITGELHQEANNEC